MENRGRKSKFENCKPAIVKIFNKYPNIKLLMDIFNSEDEKNDKIRQEFGIYNTIKVSRPTVVKFAQDNNIPVISGGTYKGRVKGTLNRDTKIIPRITQEKAAEFIRATNKKNVIVRKEMFDYFCGQLGISGGIEVLEFAKLCEVI